MTEMTKRYQREQALMLSIIHSHGMDVARNHLAKHQQHRSGPTSWLGQQRRNVSSPYLQWTHSWLTTTAARTDTATIDVAWLSLIHDNNAFTHAAFIPTQHCYRVFWIDVRYTRFLISVGYKRWT